MKRISMVNLFVHVKKKLQHNLKTIFVFLSIFLSVVSCDPIEKSKTQYHLPKEQQEWMTQFFQHLLFEETAVFTLLGTKPITRAVLYHYTQKELQEWVNGMTQEEKETLIYKEDDQFEENWVKWEKVQDQFPMKRYLLFKRVNEGKEKCDFVYFVNILETALVLQKHYEFFKTLGGEEFNSFDMACDFRNEQSVFWDKVLSNAVSLGILLGFGENNSWSFHWKHSKHDMKNKAFADSIAFEFSDKQRCKSTLKDFSIPIFASFDRKRDPIIKKYQNEKKEIIKEYQGQNFLDLILQKLTS